MPKKDQPTTTQTPQSEQSAAAPQMARRQPRWKASTDGAIGNLILGAAFWSQGVCVEGTFLRTWTAPALPNTQLYSFKADPVFTAFVDDHNRVVSGEDSDKSVTVDKFSVGSTGFRLALQTLEDMGFPGFNRGDRVRITCTGFQPNADRSLDDMVKFEIEVG